MTLRSEVEALVSNISDGTVSQWSALPLLRDILAAHPDDKAAMWEWCAARAEFPWRDNRPGCGEKWRMIETISMALSDTPEEAVRKAMKAEQN